MQDAWQLSGKTAVCGVGLRVGVFPEESAMALAVDAYRQALDDAGMKREDVDGIIDVVDGTRLRPLSRSDRQRRALRQSGLDAWPFHRADAAAGGDGGRDRHGEGRRNRARPQAPRVRTSRRAPRCGGRASGRTAKARRTARSGRCSAPRSRRSAISTCMAAATKISRRSRSRSASTRGLTASRCGAIR